MDLLEFVKANLDRNFVINTGEGKEIGAVVGYKKEGEEHIIFGSMTNLWWTARGNMDIILSNIPYTSYLYVKPEEIMDISIGIQTPARAIWSSANTVLRQDPIYYFDCEQTLDIAEKGSGKLPTEEDWSYLFNHNRDFIIENDSLVFGNSIAIPLDGYMDKNGEVRGKGCEGVYWCQNMRVVHVTDRGLKFSLPKIGEKYLVRLID